MGQQQGSGGAPPPGVAPPSGLFPAERAPRGQGRPTYREPHPVRGGAVAAGATLTAAWLLLVGLLGRQLAGYVWYTVLAGGIAWLAAWLLTRYGDRGAAAGIAIATGVGWSVATAAVAIRWAETGDWPLW
ncbi:hypothetical protein [Plantactinospora sp. GCM10030261]|uniref:hypothetical protein n=1 Tax=Plantactinospora sp. GCM10030261 TaxID=3273420 RepID=UPI00360CF9BA